jgi:hypothetical protein
MMHVIEKGGDLMRTRWLLAVSILVLVAALIPRTLRAAEMPCNAQPTAPVVATAPAPVVASTPVPVAETLPVWGPALIQQVQLPEEVVREPIFLISCSSCVPAIKCFKSQACLRAGCC